ncbi:LysR family transcriptional regulator [Gilvimarinus agarilyticus]|uniref:LysR family transcriptional regulator n=1 Tax=unclassified Gilvimarinus TaxID=2642066 RepID=UPI001C08E4E0|nr:MULTISPECIES: LysR family transcriptional regulator [unclassified Gilvimarinus]MBU2885076.1 LysR family transcriptional regulator [Gilvimarinus agarilyticus]MDO6569973.1 LysR family transcriptional regulator [Gilvimarinus sp. 2_MG-2023]MDO6747239.1 LysR family transcriptional regulator [Gilvimarinus sp. 1_MG-2023]
MDTQHITTFMAVAELGSFSLAAERLHLTQPAVSKRIALLEQSLRAKLFDRIGKQLSLTHAGNTLLPRAEHILELVSEAEHAIDRLNNRIAGKLSIATSHHIGLHHLPPVLQRFSSQYPDVNLDLHFLDSEKALEAVEQGLFDLGVITLPDTAPAGIEQIPVWHDELHFVASPSHPLAGRHINLSDLAQHKAILPDSNTYTTALVGSMFADQSLTLNVDMVTNHLDTIKMMVAIGLGWGVLPTSMLDASLCSLTLGSPALSRRLGVIYHRNRHQSNPAQKFIESLQAGGVDDHSAML